MSNFHEQLDNFSAQSTKTKSIVVAVILLIVIATLAGVFFLGKNAGREQADSKYLRERDERIAQIAVFEADAKKRLDNERQLQAENALLKAQNDMTANILRVNDAKLSGDAAKLNDLLTARNKRIEEVNADENYLSLRLGLCNDVAAAGFPLSDEFCKGKMPMTPNK